MFGSIVGGSIVKERHRCAQEVAKRNVSGLATDYEISVWAFYFHIYYDLQYFCEKPRNF